jgi:Spy/CpxP family protein refolding chaperone
MRRIIWTTLGAALIVAGITAAWAQTEQWGLWHGRRFHHGSLDYVARQLELSDAQRSQIKSMWEIERPNISVLVREFASEQKEMDAITFQGGAPDEGRIQDIAARQGATLAKLFAEKEKLTGEIYSLVLDSDQRARADKLRKRWNSHLDQVADRISNTSGRK